MSTKRDAGLMALAALPGLGPVNIRKLDDELDGRAEELLEMPEEERARWCNPGVVGQLGEWKRYFDPDQVAAELERLEGDWITFEHPDYPKRLAPYSDRPVGLYRVRAGKTFPERCVAIVGTRRPSAYGRHVAREFAAELSRAGFLIVSGMAEGIDTEAHRAVLDTGGNTAAVLGGGLNRVYPASNRELMAEISESGGVWSEFPLWRKADRRSFPQRNRIVSGVSEGVIVVESGLQGGSLITARLATEQGKGVYVVPGRIDSASSAGCHALIRDGAQLVTSVEEVLDDLSYLPALLSGGGREGGRPAQSSSRRPAPELDGNEAAVWEFIGEHPIAHVDLLADKLGLPVAEISRIVLDLEINGHLNRRLDGCYERS
jgi:DNA processing protein